jgi:hypothetical protein
VSLVAIQQEAESRVWKIEETWSQRLEDIDTGVPSDEQLSAIKLCGKRDESLGSIPWCPGVRVEGVKLVNQRSRVGLTVLTLAESRPVDIGGGTVEVKWRALWRCPESIGPDRLLRFLLPYTITSPQMEIWVGRRAVAPVLADCLVDVLAFLLLLMTPPHVLLPWICFG